MSKTEIADNPMVDSFHPKEGNIYTALNLPQKSSFKVFKLPKNFVHKYSRRKPPFGFNGLGELVFRRTYSRLKEDGNNEQWFETVERVVNGTYNMQKRWVLERGLPWSEHKAVASAKEMYDRMYNMKFLPPGRGLWAMGSSITEEKKLYMSLNNCFAPWETILTKEFGVVSFNEILNKGEVSVYTKNGWKPALINSFGKQEVQRITFAPCMPNPFGDDWRKYRSNYRVVITATPNHTWITTKGKTTNLKNNDIVLGNITSIDKNSDEYVDGFKHGLIFGDGALTYKGKNHYAHQLRLCGKKSQSLIHYFEKITYPKFANGDALIYETSKLNLKEYPDFSFGENYISGFISGWIEADGYKKDIENPTINSQREDCVQWIKKYAAFGGYFITGINQDSVIETNYGMRNSPMNRISLTQNQVNWKVVSIEKLDEPIEVYCASVQEDLLEFTLSSGIYTGNCAFVSTEHLDDDFSKPFIFLMDCSMLGVGVGFDTKGAGKIIIREPKKYRQPEIYQIPDSREGWVISVEILLDSYFKGTPEVFFNYDLIRKEGEPIKGFGGVSSGYKPLAELHETLRKILNEQIGEPISTTTIVDIMNLIGKCVVSGNVRRTAEIVFGDYNSEEYLDLKNYSVNPHRENFGWTSNNSIYAELGMNYEPCAERTRINGEPGYAWLENMRSFGRMIDPPNNKDYRAAGGNPCLEQTLESYELCCLVENFPNRHKDLDDFLRTLKFSYLYAKTVTLGETHWVETNRVLLRNRRIGCSVSGITQFLAEKGIHELKNWLEKGYETIQQHDSTYSDWLCIPKSIKTTSIKPSGSVSLLAGATPGVHFPISEYYIRRMRLGKNSELVKPLQKAGYKIEPAFGNEDNTVVVEIPVWMGENIRSDKNVSMWEKLSLAAFMQKYWADNQVSSTITFNPETEGKDIAFALNFFQYQLKGISFLPIKSNVYKQMPYEPITEEQYDELMSKIKRIDFSKVHTEIEELEKFCDGESCKL